MAMADPDATFNFIQERLAGALETMASIIRLCPNITELRRLFGNRMEMCGIWLDGVADSLIEAGVVVNVVDEFKNGLKMVAMRLADLGLEVFEQLRKGRFEDMIKTLLTGTASLLSDSLYWLVMTMYQAIMAMFKSGVIIMFKGSAAFLAPKPGTYWHLGAFVGAGVGVCLAPTLPAFAAGAAVGTVAVGAARWAFGP